MSIYSAFIGQLCYILLDCNIHYTSAYDMGSELNGFTWNLDNDKCMEGSNEFDNEMEGSMVTEQVNNESTLLSINQQMMMLLVLIAFVSGIIGVCIFSYNINHFKNGTVIVEHE
eukprot:313850_1